MPRAVSVLEVRDPALWAELSAQVHVEVFLGEALAPTRRVVTDEKGLLRAFGEAGIAPLVRYPRRDAAEVAAHTHDLAHRIEALPARFRRVLHAAQRHALDGVVIGLHAWDPIEDADAVRALLGAGLLVAEADGAPPFVGRHRLDDDLPPRPTVPFDASEAAMEETDDLEEAGPSIVALLHDLASLAAALQRFGPRRTHAGPLAKADAQKLGRQLGDDGLARDGKLEAHPRWGRALGALEALGAVSMDPVTRELFVDTGIERTIAGEAADAVDRLLHRLVERDLHVVVPAIREALREAGAGAVDEVVFLDNLREQVRDVIFPSWVREGVRIYPMVAGERVRLYDDDGWDAIEARLIQALLDKLRRLGIIRRAPGVFAATEDGRLWAGVRTRPAPPVWVTSDLEVMVPPEAVTPWERFQLERLSRCLGRDVVDRYKLEREALVHWLSTHDVDEAVALLRRRAPGVPPTVVETLETWAAGATRIVIVRGVVID